MVLLSDIVATGSDSVMKSEYDSKGDMVVGTGNDTIATLSLGENDEVLTVASGEATGLKWSQVGGISWTIVSGTSVNCVKNNGYLIDATSNDVLLHLPTSPSEGDLVGFCDFKNMAETNTITISGSNNIEGDSATLNLNVNGAGFNLVYTDSSRGWEVVSEIGAGGTNYRYVDRGDPTSWDWEVGDLTTNGGWHDLDCSSIVSSDAVSIVFKLAIQDGVAGSTILLRKNGNSNAYNTCAIRTQIADIYNDAVFIVPCDSNQVVEYYGTNTGFSAVSICIMGWFTAGGSAGGDVCSDSDIGDNKLVRGDGGAKKIQECSTITVTDNGEMINTGQPCFLVQPSATQSNIAVNTDVTIVFGTEKFDVGNNFASNTFTAPLTGKYQLNTNIYLNAIDTGATYILAGIVTSNNSFYVVMDPNYTADAAYGNLAVSGLVDMDENDTAYVYIRQSGGAQQMDITGSSRFSGVLIC